jgi:hypothetical protein
VNYLKSKHLRGVVFFFQWTIEVMWQAVQDISTFWGYSSAGFGWNIYDTQTKGQMSINKPMVKYLKFPPQIPTLPSHLWVQYINYLVFRFSRQILGFNLSMDFIIILLINSSTIVKISEAIRILSHLKDFVNWLLNNILIELPPLWKLNSLSVPNKQLTAFILYLPKCRKHYNAWNNHDLHGVIFRIIKIANHRTEPRKMWTCVTNYANEIKNVACQCVKSMHFLLFIPLINC